MTPRNRMLKTTRGETADRVPLELAGFHYQSRAGVEKVADPLRRDIAERIFDESDYRATHPSHINRSLATPPQRMRHETKSLPNGETESRTIIDTPKGELTAIRRTVRSAGTSWQVKYPVETRDDIDKIASVPWELPSGLAPPDANKLPDDSEERLILSTTISSPFVCVAGMMDYQWFLELCATDMPLMKELTEICRQRVLDCVKALLSGPGIDYVWLGGSEWVTPPMASPRVYDELVQEQERDVISYIHDNSDAVVHVHCHGHVRDALPKVIERGGDYLEPVEPPPDGDITMAEAKEQADGRVTLGGNVECRLLCNEPADTVEAATRAAFEGGKRRFVLRPTEGPSPRLTEREHANYMRMIDVWEELSPIEHESSSQSSS